MGAPDVKASAMPRFQPIPAQVPRPRRAKSGSNTSAAVPKRSVTRSSAVSPCCVAKRLIAKLAPKIATAPSIASVARRGVQRRPLSKRQSRGSG